MPRIWLIRSVVGAGFVLAGMALGSAGRVSRVEAQSASQPGPAPNSVEFYNSNVKPIFEANCFRCHGGMNHRGGLQMDTRAGMAKGGRDGAVIVPGHPEQSLLVKLIRHEGPADDPMPMPPRGDKISDANIATVEQWVKAGAVMPEDVVKP